AGEAVYIDIINRASKYVYIFTPYLVLDDSMRGALCSNDKRFKGIKADYYRENGVYKYTCGASTDYNAIARKRKELSKKFKEAFIVAFKNGKRMDTNKAIKEFKNKNR
ncbi:MAG: hypothetical protein IKC85_07840, partial [Bacteroidaceae bacterium]|nr:hypothetical protein [Bacteroidaceae bacterium]